MGLRFDRSIQLLRASASGSGALGTHAGPMVWGGVGDPIAADRADLSDRERFGALGEATSATVRFTVWRDPLTETITPTDALRDGSETFDIERVKARDGNGHYIEITAALQRPAGDAT